MQRLPIDDAIPDLVGRLERAGALVLVAPPGTGKTTRVPPALLGPGKVLVSQPRRIAAQATAARIADERGWTLGEEVGYRVRFESRCSPRTRLEIQTEGLLLRRLLSDPSLDGVHTVVLDEFHERSLTVDLLLPMLREVREGLRPELRLVVMSATLDPGPVAAFLGDAPVVQLPERQHPVDVRYVDRIEDEDLAVRVSRHLAREWSGHQGHCLVFLPGYGEIRACERALGGFAADAGAELMALHGSMPLDAQRRALAVGSRRRILLATNVAETSLTVDGVDLVIDSGLRRRLRHDVRRGLDRLVTERVSRHSADQRAGRAGRTGPGSALRLWPRAEHARLPQADPPELHTAGLEGVCLQLHAWGLRRAADFAFLDPPPAAALDSAEQLLRRLGAVDAGGALGEQGRFQATIPAHPRLSRLLWTCAHAGRAAEGALLVALLEERDLRAAGGRPPAAPTETGPSDLLADLDLLRTAQGQRDPAAWARRQGLRPEVLRSVLRVARDLEKAARGVRAPRQPGEEPLLRAILAAFPDRLVRRRAVGDAAGPMVDGRRVGGRMVGGGGVRLARESVVQDAEYYVAVELGDTGRGRNDPLVRRASAVQRSWLDDFPEAREERRHSAFDERLLRVRTTVQDCFGDLPLDEPREVPTDPEQAVPILREALRSRAGPAFLARPTSARLLARLRYLAREVPELELPPLDDEGLAELLSSRLSPTDSLRGLEQRDLAGMLRACLPHAVAASLDQWVPETWTAPTGNRITLDYSGERPVLAVRVQELFGSTDTPRVLRGRQPVVLHLLGPNHRPVQITEDLAGFWERTYPQVRRDLRGRYPKHAWPEDPRHATPESRPRRRRGP